MADIINRLDVIDLIVRIVPDLELQRKLKWEIEKLPCVSGLNTTQVMNDPVYAIKCPKCGCNSVYSAYSKKGWGLNCHWCGLHTDWYPDAGQAKKAWERSEVLL